MTSSNCTLITLFLLLDMEKAPKGRRGSSAREGSGSGRDSGQPPTEEIVERMEEKLEAAQADQKNLFLIIFQVNSGSVWKLVPLLFPQLNLVHCEIEQLNQN